MYASGTVSKILLANFSRMSEQREQQILAQEERLIKTTQRRVAMLAYGLLVAASLGIFGWAYLAYSGARISIEKAQLSAPMIDLAASAPGVLQETDVHIGDIVLPNTVVARVDTQIIKTKLGGLVVAVQDTIGKRFNPGEPIVSMIDPRELRVVGQLAEDKGLKDVHVGQRAEFTVDAFGSRTFYGTVDSVSPTSRESGIVFNISDKRETKNFDIHVRFDTTLYPELKNGMSAKITVFK